MYPTSVDLQVHQERYKDLVRDAQRARLIREAGLQPPRPGEIIGKLVRRLDALRAVSLRSRSAACSGQRCC